MGICLHGDGRVKECKLMRLLLAQIDTDNFLISRLVCIIFTC